MSKPEHKKILAEMNAALMQGKAPLVAGLVRTCLEAGLAPTFIMQKALVPAMAEVGRRFQADEMFMPEVMIAARAMNAGLEILEPALAREPDQKRGTVLMATVKGDLHDVGKNMVSMMFKGAGYRVVDLGIDQSPRRIIAGLEEHKPQVVGLSALLTLTLPAMADTVAAITAAGLDRRVVILVGGAPVTQAFAEQIGAHGYAPDAFSAVQVAGRLLDRQGGDHG